MDSIEKNKLTDEQFYVNKLIRFISLITFSVSALCIVFFDFFPPVNYKYILYLTTLGSLITPILLTYSYYKLARVVSIISGNILTTFICSLLGTFSFVETLYVTWIVYSFVIFHRSFPKYVVASILVSLICFYILIITDYTVFVAEHVDLKNKLEINITLIIASILFIYELLRYENKFKDLAKEKLLANIQAIEKANLHLINKEKKLANIFNTIPTTILITDIKNNIIIYSNLHAKSFLGLNLDTLLNSPIDFNSIFVSENDKIDLSESLLKGNDLQNFEIQLKEKNNTIFWASINSSHILIDDVKYNLLLIEDITLKKEETSQLIKNKQLFSAVFHKSADALFIVNSETFEIVNSNKRAEELFKSADLRYFDTKTIWDLFNSSPTAEFKYKIDSICSNNNTFTSEFTFSKSNQDHFWGLFSCKKFDYGNERLVLVRITDISNLKNIQETLEDTNERLSLALSTGNIGIWEMNLKTLDLLWNDQMYHIFEIEEGVEPHSFEHFIKFVHPDDREKLIANLDVYNINYDIIKSHKLRIVTPSGKLKYIQTSAKLFYDKNGIPYRIIGTSKDITQRVNEEKLLISAKNKAEQASQSKAQFLSIMSHELRTPLNGVIGLTRLLKEEDPKPEQLENINILEFSANQLLALINNILDFSKIEANKIELELIPFCLIELLTNIESQFKFKTKEKNLFFELIYPEKKVNLIGDPHRITQIITNLVGNAIKFTPNGGITVNCNLNELNDLDYSLNIEIIDTGIGIEKDKIPHIFNPFSQANSNISRLYGGSGLGLAITKKLVDLLNGTIYIKSDLGIGTTFYLEIPLKAQLEENPKTPEIINSNASDKEIDLSDLRVLVVEDNDINILVTGKMLKKWNVKYHIAKNGKEAVILTQANGYDLILMDLHMPEMNGFEACTEIRKSDKSIPIFALTADAFTEVRQKALKTGFNGYITKPYKIDELYSSIIYAYQLKNKKSTQPLF